MNTTIHKTELPVYEGSYSIPLPEGHKILSVGNARNSLCVWYECSNGRPFVTVEFFLAVTGGYLPQTPGWTFQGTVILQDGYYVTHVYTRTK